MKKIFFFEKKKNFYLINMPISRKKLAAKKRLEYQSRNTDSGRFEEQFSDSEYELSDITYSTDSSDKNSQELKTNIIEVKKKASYTGSSTATYYRKYGPSGTYTKAAKGSLLLTEFFAPAQSNLANINLTEDDETGKNNDLDNDDTDRMDVSDGEENSDNDFNTNEITDLEDFDDVFTEEEDNNEFNLNTVNRLEKLKQILDGNKKNQTAYDYL
jgi:hypothetical protein